LDSVLQELQYLAHARIGHKSLQKWKMVVETVCTHHDVYKLLNFKVFDEATKFKLA